jgi:hypothetical protein
LSPDQFGEWKSKPGGFMAWLRSHTLALGGRTD